MSIARCECGSVASKDFKISSFLLALSLKDSDCKFRPEASFRESVLTFSARESSVKLLRIMCELMPVRCKCFASNVLFLGASS